MIVTVTCPACWQPTAVEVDVAHGPVEQYEDCQVCCRPMRIRAVAQPTAWDDEIPEIDVQVEADG